MPDDASGYDGDDDGHEEAPPTGPDVQNSNEGRGRNADNWGSDHDDRADRDDWISATDADGVARDENRDDEYRVPLDLSGGTDETDEADTDEDDPYAPEPSSKPIEPGDPDLENVLFVFFGAVVMVLVLFRLLSVAF